MKSYVFLIAETPSQFSNPLRDELRKICYQSLKMQDSNDWTALIIGEKDLIDENLIYLKSDVVTKYDKLKFGLNYISQQQQKPKYLIRFDDDDIFSKTILTEIKNIDFDCFADKFQLHLNIADGKISFNSFSWLANTIIQKWEHAISTENNDNQSLILCDHSIAFHKYYENKKIFYTRKKNPIFIRLLSPTCHTIENVKVVDNSFNYQRFIDGFGYFGYFKIENFNHIIPEINSLVKEYFNIEPPNKNLMFRNVPSFSFFKLIHLFSLFKSKLGLKKNYQIED